MAVAAEKINAWFDFAARECFEERHWEVAARLPEATLSHRSGALGALLCGHLIRFDMTNIFVERAPENPCNLLVRPEVRGQYDQGAELQLWWRRTLAPGDSMVERTSKLWVLRMASLLFDDNFLACGKTGPVIPVGISWILCPLFLSPFFTSWIFNGTHVTTTVI